MPENRESGRSRNVPNAVRRMPGRRSSHWKIREGRGQVDEAKSEDRPDAIDRTRADGGQVLTVFALKGVETCIVGENDAT